MRVTHSRLPHVVAVLAEEMQDSGPLVALEDLRRPVLGAVVRRDHEVDAGVEVEGDLRVHDVGLVADEERHHELHATAHSRLRITSSLRKPSIRVSS